ncbi:tRNA (guanine(37)-N1)-methyltransferase [Coleophoma crateriformis]|uniref:tRNA (guanine(37)-N1)-methyltransferase n=1 Tax=Coleophoma crateriformis TaxID=565419 RepID=A0A3D8QES3_9HELO|nr:tRNA (guanine(37)-N1)-methyltransferase [Coleophoma crateriformis]
MSLFRPPIVRSASGLLDRSLFSKTIPLAAARIANVKNVSKIRAKLEGSREVLKLERTINVRPDPDSALASKGGRCLLLKPEVKVGDSTTWSDTLKEAVNLNEVGVIPYNLELDYKYWTYQDIMESVLPEEDQGEIPTGFAIVGHVAHLNLRDAYLPYKHIIAEVIADKNNGIRTIINKVNDVGAESEFRTFAYEVLYGPDDMNVEIKEQECLFRFDYSKVYWNSRLNTEHERLVEAFEPGVAVCDLMAGVGPFAVPAGKKKVFVWANDLNPDSIASMRDAVVRNKVQAYVRPHCENAHKFIYSAVDDLLNLTATSQNTVTIPGTASSRNLPKEERERQILERSKTITIPQTFSHFVMNLPATAIEFLGSFNGLYRDHAELFTPHTNVKLPMIHVHCFSTKSEDNVREGIDICNRISKYLDYTVTPQDKELVIYEVRDVAPNKRMFCASFRLPAEVAFRERRNV